MDGDTLVTDLPHFQSPFGFTSAGAIVVEQDDPEEIATCVYNIAVCPLGFLAHDPDFGVDDLTGSTIPVDTSGLLAEIGEQEPRAATIATESGSPFDTTLRTIALTVSGRSAGD
jgi:hypothetical protein